MKNKKVESFELDHTKVIAPYVRKCARMYGEKGDCVTKFDLRFLQPNKSEMPTGGIHAIEHFLAYEIRNHIDGVIDLSPLGCRTGFYLTIWGDRNIDDIKRSLEESLEIILEAKEIPANNEVQCGNFKDLSLESAKEITAKVLTHGFKVI